MIIIIISTPTYYSGTVKENLDPVGFYSLRRLTEIIKKCRLEKLVSRAGGELVVSTRPGDYLIVLFSLLSGLNGTILEQGTTFSAGEKQLLCLARAVLSPCKIVLIDEVTP